MRSMTHQIQYAPQKIYNSPLPIYQQQHHQINPNIYRGYNQIPLSHSMIYPQIYQTNPQLKSNLQFSRVSTSNNGYKLQETKFPFGKEHAKIVKYVQDQLGKDEENRKMLEKFRQDAINYRNNRKSNGVGKAVYTTQSMNPGSSNNPIVKNLQKISIQNRINTQIVNPNPYYIYRPSYYYQPQQAIQESPNRYQTISLKRQFSKKGYKKKLKQKIKLQELRQKSQEKWEQLQTMIVKVNSQIKKNSRLISQNMPKSHAKSSITSKDKKIELSNKKKSIFYQTFHSQQTQQPAIQYSKSIAPTNPQKQKIKDIRKHLDLLKKHKKRLQSINQNI